MDKLTETYVALFILVVVGAVILVGVVLSIVLLRKKSKVNSQDGGHGNQEKSNKAYPEGNVKQADPVQQTVIQKNLQDVSHSYDPLNGVPLHQNLNTNGVLHNRYRIVSLLGRGGFGAVYRAWDIALERPCAVKENLETGFQAQQQFQREAVVLANLSHPNLPRVTDHFVL
jgi:hypothetical protein